MVSVMRIFQKKFYKVLLVLSVSMPRQVLYIYSNKTKYGFSPSFTIPLCFNFLIHCTAINCSLIWHSFPDNWESTKQLITKLFFLPGTAIATKIKHFHLILYVERFSKGIEINKQKLNAPKKMKL